MENIGDYEKYIEKKKGGEYAYDEDAGDFYDDAFDVVGMTDEANKVRDIFDSRKIEKDSSKINLLLKSIEKFSESISELEKQVNSLRKKLVKLKKNDAEKKEEIEEKLSKINKLKAVRQEINNYLPSEYKKDIEIEPIMRKIEQN